MPVQSDLQTSEWYSYFENDVLAKRMFPNPAKPVLGTPFTRPYGLLLLMLAALIAYGARSLTCGLAGCLALTASTFFYSVL